MKKTLYLSIVAVGLLFFTHSASALEIIGKGSCNEVPHGSNPGPNDYYCDSWNYSGVAKYGPSCSSGIVVNLIHATHQSAFIVGFECAKMDCTRDMGTGSCVEVPHGSNPGTNDYYCDSWNYSGDASSAGCSTGIMTNPSFGPRNLFFTGYSCVSPCSASTGNSADYYNFGAPDNSCAVNTCTNSQCWNNLAMIAGAKDCRVDNGCAANTCTTATCYNSITWVPGTKDCKVDNGCAANTCTTDTCNNSISTVRGTRVCDNGCAINTCVGKTCNNGITTVAGTKPCDNGCAARTCTTTTCNNGISTVQGTKNCPLDNSCADLTCNTTQCVNNLGDLINGTKVCTDNGCAANTCIDATCINGITWVPGTKVCACTVADTCTTKTCNGVAGTKVCDPNCAANTCTTDTCDNGTAVIPGTKICICTVADTCTTKTCNGVAGTKVCDSNCATKTCVGQTCDNGTNPNTPGTKASVFVDTCVATEAEKTCTQADCERNIVKQVQACSKIDQSGCSAPKACTTGLTCPTLRQTCPACSLTVDPNGGTVEVAPQ